MSCAVMFQPSSFGSDGLSLPSSHPPRTDSHPPNGSGVPSPYSSSHPHHHYSAHCKPLYSATTNQHLHQGLQSSLDRLHHQRPPSSCRTPSSKHSSGASQGGAEEVTEKAFKKLCSNERVPIPTVGGLASPLHQSPVTPVPSATQGTESDVKYVSANCVVVTHYRGDAASVVDEHFSRALATKTSKGGETPVKVISPMSSRSFPPSFYQPPSTRPPMSFGVSFGAAHPHNHSDLYDAYHGGIHHSLQAASGTDPWTTYSISPQAYAHRSMGHDMYHQAMASTSHHPYQYSSLGFQQPFTRIPSVPVPSQMNKSDVWGNRYYDSFHGASDHIPSGLESSYSSHYHNMAGLEAAGMTQESAKEFYWSL